MAFLITGSFGETEENEELHLGMLVTRRFEPGTYQIQA